MCVERILDMYEVIGTETCIAAAGHLRRAKHAREIARQEGRTEMARMEAARVRTVVVP
jgi:hypothetical protein